MAAVLDRIAPKTAPTGVATATGAESAQPMGAINPNPALSPDAANTANVSQRLPGITSKSGVLGRVAMTRGKQYAQSRGMLHSSLGAHASHRALLDWAVPIAQSDTQHGLAMHQERGVNRRFDADLGFRREQEAGVDRRFDADLGFRKTQHTEDVRLREQELSDLMTRFDKAQGLERERLAKEIQQRQAELNAANARHSASLSAAASNLRMQLAADAERQKASIEAEKELQTERITADLDKLDKTITQDNKNVAVSSVNQAYQQFNAKINNYQNNPDMSEAAKKVAVDAAKKTLDIQLKTVAAVAKVPINLDDAVKAAGGTI